MKQVSGAVGEDSEDDQGEPVSVAAVAPRPARLGLGAKFIPHSAALNTRDTGVEGV